MDVKRTTLMDRLRAARKAFFGSRIGTITMGVEVRRCDECEHKNPDPTKKRMVFYICDRKACDPCNNPDCKHTPKIEHAVNFKSNVQLGMNNGFDDYWEQEHKEAV